MTRNPHLWHWSFYSVPDLPEALIVGKEGVYFSWFLKNFAVNYAAVEAATPRVVTEFTGPGNVRAVQLFRARDTAAQLNTQWAKTNRLEVPVLALGADGGTGSTLFDQMSTVADHVEGGVIKNCGHWVVIEQPQAFLDRVGTFLAGRSQLQP